jgi:hypothetical protein
MSVAPPPSPAPGQGMEGRWVEPTTEGNGYRLFKVYEGNPQDALHRANLFRRGVPSADGASIRQLATIVLWACGVIGAIALVVVGSSDDVEPTAAVVLLGCVVAVIWAIVVLVQKHPVYFPSVRPDHFDALRDTALGHAERVVYEHLRYEEDEDVRAKAAFVAGVPKPLGEVVVSPTAPPLIVAHPSAPGIDVRYGPDGRQQRRYSRYETYHAFANAMGLTYVRTRYDPVVDGPPVPHVVESDRWLWPSIENLRVGERQLTIQTTGGQEFHLSYIAQDAPAPTGKAAVPGQQPPVGTGPAPHLPAPQAPPPSTWDGARADEAITAILARERGKAMTFVNTANILREEWMATTMPAAGS